MNRIFSLQFYLVSSSSAGPWLGALPLQLQGPNYNNGDTNTFSKRMFEQLTGWQICQVPLSSEGFSFRGPLPWPPGRPGALPLNPAKGSASKPSLQPPLQTPWPRHWMSTNVIKKHLLISAFCSYRFPKCLINYRYVKLNKAICSYLQISTSNLGLQICEIT